MALKVGDKAPEFELTTITAAGPKKVRLSDNRSQKNTMLWTIGRLRVKSIWGGY